MKLNRFGKYAYSEKSVWAVEEGMPRKTVGRGSYGAGGGGRYGQEREGKI